MNAKLIVESRETDMADMDIHQLRVNLDLVAAAMSQGQEAWNDDSLPLTLVGLHVPSSLLGKFRLLTDAAIQAAEHRNEPPPHDGLQAEIETKFITCMILNGLRTHAASLLEELQRRNKLAGQGKS